MFWCVQSITTELANPMGIWYTEASVHSDECAGIAMEVRAMEVSMKRFDIRIRNLVAPRTPTLFRGSAEEAKAWLEGRAQSISEDLFMEVKTSRAGYPPNTWHQLRRRLELYVAQEKALV